MAKKFYIWNVFSQLLQTFRYIRIRLTVYPNPLNIGGSLSIDGEINRIEIFDSKGVLQNLPIRKTSTGYAIGGFKAAGVYLLQIYSANLPVGKNIETVKVVIK